MIHQNKTQRQGMHLTGRVVLSLSAIMFCALLFFAGSSSGIEKTAGTGEQPSHRLYPDKKEKLTTAQCMQCHPKIASLLRSAGTMHGRVKCRQCHLQIHTYVPGKTNYEDILPKCTRCHGHPHGEELVHCSSCHQEAHSPLSIPASRALSQGCSVCHPVLNKEMKTFSTRHTDLYCTACHHTKHGYVPSCLECHQQHTGTVPTSGEMPESTSPLDQCLSCHPPHKALNVVYPDNTPNSVCSFCHRKVKDMLQKSNTKHTALHCTRCHPGQHKTIKRCVECHGRPHPKGLLNKFSTCGGCHGVAHSVVR